MSARRSVGSACEPFVPLAERIVDALLESRPGLATSRRRPPVRRPAARPLRRRGRRRPGDAAGRRRRTRPRVDTDALDVERAGRPRAADRLVDRALFELTEIRDARVEPAAAQPGPAAARAARPPVRAGRGAAGRAWPGGCRPYRTPWRPRARRCATCPRIHAETAVGQFAGTAALIRDEVPRLLRRGAGAASARSSRPRPRDRRAGGVRRPGCARAWPPTPGRGATRGWAGGAGRPGSGTPSTPSWAPPRCSAGPGPTWTGSPPRSARRPSSWSVARPTTRRYAGALDLLAAEHPDDDSIVDLASVTLDEATDFVRAHDLVTLVDDPCVIQEMPEFARGVAVAYCDSPGPAGDGRRADLLLHRADPGGLAGAAGRVVLPRVQRPHDPQPDRARGDAGPLPPARPRPPVRRPDPGPRASAESGPFIEGWAVYAEELMAEPRLRRPAGAVAAAQDAAADDHQRDPRPARALRRT